MKEKMEDTRAIVVERRREVKRANEEVVEWSRGRVVERRGRRRKAEWRMQSEERRGGEVKSQRPKAKRQSEGAMADMRYQTPDVRSAL
jgi:hypothetical protein